MALLKHALASYLYSHSPPREPESLPFLSESQVPGLDIVKMKFPKIYNTYFLAIVATMGGMLFGFDISSMSAIIGVSIFLYLQV